MQQGDNSRRSFLKQALAGSAIVAGSSLVGKKARAQKIAETKRPDEVLYQKTEAFKKYYNSLR